MKLSNFRGFIERMKLSGLIHEIKPNTSKSRLEVLFRVVLDSTEYWIRSEDLYKILTAEEGILYEVLKDNYVILNQDLLPLKDEVSIVRATEPERDVAVTKFSDFITITSYNSLQETLHADLQSVLAVASSDDSNSKIFRLYIDDRRYAFLATENAYIRILGFLIKMSRRLEILTQATSGRSNCRIASPIFVSGLGDVNLGFYIKYGSRKWWKWAMWFAPRASLKLK